MKRKWPCLHNFGNGIKAYETGPESTGISQSYVYSRQSIHLCILPFQRQTEPYKKKVLN